MTCDADARPDAAATAAMPATCNKEKSGHSATAPVQNIMKVANRYGMVADGSKGGLEAMLTAQAFTQQQRILAAMAASQSQYQQQLDILLPARLKTQAAAPLIAGSASASTFQLQQQLDSLHSARLKAQAAAPPIAGPAAASTGGRVLRTRVDGAPSNNPFRAPPIAGSAAASTLQSQQQRDSLLPAQLNAEAAAPLIAGPAAATAGLRMLRTRAVGAPSNDQIRFKLKGKRFSLGADVSMEACIAILDPSEEARNRWKQVQKGKTSSSEHCATSHASSYCFRYSWRHFKRAGRQGTCNGLYGDLRRFKGAGRKRNDLRNFNES